MKLLTGCVLLVGMLATPAYGGNPLGASATLTPATAGSRATLALKLRYDMQCGQPGPGTVVVQLPSRMHPMPSLAVRVNANVITDAKISGTTLTIPLPAHKGVTCMVIGPGAVTLSLVGVRNPTSPGAYVVRARVRGMSFAATVAVRA
jgi:hypothetical protein